MKCRKIMRSYRLPPFLVDHIYKAAREKGVSNTHIVSIALQKYFEQNKNM